MCKKYCFIKNSSFPWNGDQFFDSIAQSLCYYEYTIDKFKQSCESLQAN